MSPYTKDTGLPHVMVSDEPEPEASAVQLTRMEGVLNLVAYKVTSLVVRVDHHENEIALLKSITQTLKEGAVADREKAEALALALKEAKEAVEATALQESNKAQAASREEAARNALGWSPVTKVFAVATILVSLFTVYLLAMPHK